MVKVLDGTWWPGRIVSYPDYVAFYAGFDRKELPRKQVTSLLCGACT